MKKKNWIYYCFKRLFDIFSSFVLIVLISPIIILLLIINLFATKGAPIYFDKRVGKNGKVIKIPKLRSMYKDANTNPEKYLTQNQMEEWKTERKVTSDPRITPFGRFLRKSSLDEILQLFSILFGKLSVVGPRPVIQSEIDLFYTKEESQLLLSARPGLISNWGVNGRNMVTYKTGERQKLELDYFAKRSFSYDLKLLFQAIGVVFKGTGAQ